MNDKDNLASALIFKYTEQLLVQGMTFILNIVLARLLLPSDYGVLSVLMIFISLSQVFVQSGLNTALVQRPVVDDEDYQTVFWSTIVIALLLYCVVYLATPWIGSFYDIENFSSYLRTLALILFPGAVNSIQIAKLCRTLDFKRLMISSVSAVVFAGFCSVLIALNGGGIWSLVVQQLVNQVSVTIILFFMTRWVPRARFSRERFQKLFSFGSRIMCVNLVETLFGNIRSLVVGKKYDTAVLGYYDRGNQFPDAVVRNINMTLMSVMFPVYSRHQNDKQALKEMVRRTMMMSSFVVWPMMVGLCVVARPFVIAVLTEKWAPCIPYIQILCFSYVFMPIHTANHQAINAMGEGVVSLRLTIVRRVVDVSCILIAAFLFDTPIALAWGAVISMALGSFINAFPNRRLLGYKYSEQVKDILPCVAVSLLMGVAIYPISFFISDMSDLLFTQIAAGIVIYFALAALFRLESFSLIVRLVRQNVSRLRSK